MTSCIADLCIRDTLSVVIGGVLVKMRSLMQEIKQLAISLINFVVC